MGKGFQYHSKLKERLIYYTRIIKDFYTIVNLVVVYTNYIKVIHLIITILIIAISNIIIY
jgi:hypothetical protein